MFHLGPLLLGAFFVAWGGWELLAMLGLVADARFPWPVLLVLVGAGFLAGAFGRRWGCAEDPEPPSREGP